MRYRCHHCEWNWPIHRWLPFDFEIARWSHRRHMWKCHRMKNDYGRYGEKWKRA